VDSETRAYCAQELLTTWKIRIAGPRAPAKINKTNLWAMWKVGRQWCGVEAAQP